MKINVVCKSQEMGKVTDNLERNLILRHFFLRKYFLRSSCNETKTNLFLRHFFGKFILSEVLTIVINNISEIVLVFRTSLFKLTYFK